MDEPTQSHSATRVPKITYGPVPTGYPNLEAMLSTMQPILGKAGCQSIRRGQERVAARTKKIKRMVIQRLAKLRDVDWGPAVPWRTMSGL